jgi:hypothetical protein
MDDAGIERAVREAADRTGIGYEVVPCDPALADTAALLGREPTPPHNRPSTRGSVRNVRSAQSGEWPLRPARRWPRRWPGIASAGGR